MFGAIEKLTEPRDRALQLLHGYWLEKKGSARAPAREAILPEELAPLLPYLALFDVLESGELRVRLWGTGLVRAYDGDLTGRLLKECDLDGIADSLAEQLAEVVSEWRPNVIRARFVKNSDDRYVEYERIALPLSADGERVNMILCGYHVVRAF